MVMLVPMDVSLPDAAMAFTGAIETMKNGDPVELTEEDQAFEGCDDGNEVDVDACINASGAVRRSNHSPRTRTIPSRF